MAIVFSSATMLTSLIIIALITLGIQIIAELSGIVLNGQQPILNGLRKLAGKKKRIYNRESQQLVGCWLFLIS